MIRCREDVANRTWEDLDAVYHERPCVHAVHLYDSHIMAVDGEGIIRVAGNRYEAEPVSTAPLDMDDC